MRREEEQLENEQFMKMEEELAIVLQEIVCSGAGRGGSGGYVELITVRRQPTTLYQYIFLFLFSFFL
eukprot:SAG11_NODE_8135_length_1056_cov_4.180773_3_plen_67_part_00